MQKKKKSLIKGVKGANRLYYLYEAPNVKDLIQEAAMDDMSI